MKIPKKIIIGGVDWIVKFKELMFEHDGVNLYGKEDETKKIIYLSRYGYEYVGLEMIKVKYQDKIYQKILFHEIWHVLCNILSFKDINTEEIACLFASVCAIDLKVPLSAGCDERFKEILTYGIDEIENYSLGKIVKYRNQLKYVIKRIEIIEWQEV